MNEKEYVQEVFNKLVINEETWLNYITGTPVFPGILD